MKNLQCKSHEVEGGLNVQRGVVAGFVVQYAEALDVAPEAVLDAVETAGITPMVDTGRRGSKSNANHGPRPTDPEQRCLAMTRSDFARVLAEAQSTSAESRKVQPVRG